MKRASHGCSSPISRGWPCGSRLRPTSSAITGTTRCAPAAGELGWGQEWKDSLGGQWEGGSRAGEDCVEMPLPCLHGADRWSEASPPPSTPPPAAAAAAAATPPRPPPVRASPRGQAFLQHQSQDQARAGGGAAGRGSDACWQHASPTCTDFYAWWNKRLRAINSRQVAVPACRCLPAAACRCCVALAAYLGLVYCKHLGNPLSENLAPAPACAPRRATPVHGVKPSR